MRFRHRAAVFSRELAIGAIKHGLVRSVARIRQWNCLAVQGLWSIVLYYVNERGTTTGESIELDSNRKVARVVANHDSQAQA